MEIKKFAKSQIQLKGEGFAVIENIFSPKEVEQILAAVDNADKSKSTFRKSTNLFAIRQFLKEVPIAIPLIFNDNLKNLINRLFGSDYFLVKSLYFDKPEQSNWFVAYHQDLTISVDKKLDLDNYGPWTVKQNQFAVQPPLNILENIFTIRVHLDDTNGNNGALKIVPKSHLKSIYKPETIDWSKEIETVCGVKKGGVMVMRPLLLHSSNRTTNNNKRRVIHLEFSNIELPAEINWSERLDKLN
ncbi:MAG: phytanoyl-CoA dioxygenase family protein [Bacteroidota bacterium]